MTDTSPIASLDDLTVGSTLLVEHQGNEILLCRTNDGVFAVENNCSHAQARLCEGRLKGHRLFCPLHSAAFDVRTGEALSKPATLPIATYPVSISNQQIYLD